MSFGQAVKSVFSQYATFSGRARRSEYWWFYLFTFLVSIPGAIILMVAYFSQIVPLLNSADSQGNISQHAIDNINWGVVIGSYVPTVVVGLALFLPGLAVVVRRLHDTGRSGWWYLISFVPLGSYVLLVFMFFDSQPYNNQYGPDPKASDRGLGGYPPQGYAQPTYAQPTYGQPGYPAQPYAPPGYAAPPAQPGYPAQPPYAQPAQPGYPAPPATPGYPTAPPSQTPLAPSPGTDNPFYTPGS